MNWRATSSLLLLSLALGVPTGVAQTASAGWGSVGTGIDYQEFQLPDPNNVFVARMDRSNPNVFIESSIAQGRLASGTETVSGMASRYDQAINYWGQSWGSRNDVVVAINGSFYDPATGVPEGGQIHSGWYSKQYADLGGGSGFAWKLDRTAFIGQCTHHPSTRQFLTVTRTGATQEFQGINRPRGSGELIVYTPQFDSHTNTDASGVEVLVEMTRPTLILPTPAMAKGQVREIRDGQGSTPIPFDHIILSAAGAARTKLLNILNVGDEIGISQEITHFEDDCATRYPFDWTKTYASVAGSFDFLLDGVIYSFTDPGASERHPRTAVCFNNAYLYFLVVDGRDPARSVGMTIDELATFCKQTLGAAWGINQDGGGSSTIVVNGVVKNSPSDGSERPVGNGLLMVIVEPLERSTAFAPDESIVTIAPAEVRLGPGANYLALGTVPERTEGVVLDHFNNLEGVLATGSYWWKLAFGSTVGWVVEEALASDIPTGFIVESRAGGLNYGAYSDSRLEDSSLKSNAPGTSAGIGSREGKLRGSGPPQWASFSFTPSQSGVYAVYATWAPSSNNAAQVEHLVAHADGSTSLLVDQTTGANNWNSLGQYSLSVGSTYAVKVTNENYPAPKGNAEVFRADAVLWELVSAATPTPTATATATFTPTPTPTSGPSPTPTETAVATGMHVGDLDGASVSNGSTWTTIVTITVHDSNHNPVASATVSGTWSNGASDTASCITDASGQCIATKSGVLKRTGSVTFTVGGVTHPTLTYNSADNHDPDGDSDGTSITITKP